MPEYDHDQVVDKLGPEYRSDATAKQLGPDGKYFATAAMDRTWKLWGH